MTSDTDSFFRTSDDTLPRVDIDFVLTVDVADGGVPEFSLLDFFDGDGVDGDSLFLGASGTVGFFLLLGAGETNAVPGISSQYNRFMMI